MKFPRLLIISRDAWNTTNNTGNTLSNFFSQWDKEKIANIFCRAEMPKNDICEKYYQITELDLLKNIFKKTKVGRSYNGKQLHINPTIIKQEKQIYNFFKIFRFTIFLFAREVLWKISKWRNDNLKLFLTEFSPDIIYMHVYDSFYMHDILKYAKDVTNAKVVLFFSDDVCSLKQFSLSPFFWLQQILFIRKVKLSLQITSKIYGASEMLCNEYSSLLNRNFIPLYKYGNFQKIKLKKEHSIPLILTYTGNLYYNRWKILSKIATELRKINENGIKAQLYIYTNSIISKRIYKAINIKGSSYLLGGISYKKVMEVLLKSDISVHAEAFNLKSRLATRLSFSTKIIDYFESNSCIFAIGYKKSASIDYLLKNDIAIVATKIKEIKIKLEKIINNPGIIKEYREKAWEWGKKNHSASKTQKNLYNDLTELAKNNTDKGFYYV